MYYVFNLSLQSTYAIYCQYCFLQLTIQVQLSFGKSCMNIYCILIPHGLLSTFKVLMACALCLNQQLKEVLGSSKLHEEVVFEGYVC